MPVEESVVNSADTQKTHKAYLRLKLCWSVTSKCEFNKAAAESESFLRLFEDENSTQSHNGASHTVPLFEPRRMPMIPMTAPALAFFWPPSQNCKENS